MSIFLCFYFSPSCGEVPFLTAATQPLTWNWGTMCWMVNGAIGGHGNETAVRCGCDLLLYDLLCLERALRSVPGQSQTKRLKPPLCPAKNPNNKLSPWHLATYLSLCHPHTSFSLLPTYFAYHSHLVVILSWCSACFYLSFSTCYSVAVIGWRERLELTSAYSTKWLREPPLKCVRVFGRPECE